LVTDDSSSLLRRARDGSREALNTLLADCGGRVNAFIRLRLGPGLRGQVESSDVLQLTLLRAFQNIEQFEGASRRSLVAWLVAIAQNVIRDEAEFAHRQRRDVRKNVPIGEDAETLVAEVRSEVSKLIVKEETRRLEEAMERLEPLHREVILLRKYEELRFAEIGARLGKSPDASRMLLARAMTALADTMREAS